MSTGFTSKGIVMQESRALQLTMQASALNDATVAFVTRQLVAKGYEAITPSLLAFLSVLECGVNNASSIARDLGVSRQMVAKTVKELCQQGYLEQIDGFGKQKDILFTEQGELLISDARQLLHKFDAELAKHLSLKEVDKAIENMRLMANLVKDKLNQ